MKFQFTIPAHTPSSTSKFMESPDMLKHSITLVAFGTVVTTGLASFIGRAKPTLAQVYGTDTCRQGYVWREAVPNDHVCVTPETRAQAAYDNSQACVHRNPEGGRYGTDTCRRGYVWREAVPNDHVCVTPETRAQAAYDNSQASVRRVAVQAITPEVLRRKPINRRSETLRPKVVYRETVIPSNQKFLQFVGTSRKSYQEALSDAVTQARQSLNRRYMGRYMGNDALNYKEVKREEGLSGGKWVSWVLIELESNPDYHPSTIDCPDPDPNDDIGVICQPLPSACYFRDPQRCSQK